MRLVVPPLQSTLMIGADGHFLPAPEGQAITAELSVSPAAALRILLDRESAASTIRIQGKPELAHTLGRVLQDLRWDAEEDLSRLVGDIPAHHLGNTTRHLLDQLGRQTQSIAGMCVEYWLEESPLIARRRHLEQYSRDVDALRHDTERLAKRIEKLRPRPMRKSAS